MYDFIYIIFVIIVTFIVLALISYFLNSKIANTEPCDDNERNDSAVMIADYHLTLNEMKESTNTALQNMLTNTNTKLNDMFDATELGLKTMNNTTTIGLDNMNTNTNETLETMGKDTTIALDTMIEIIEGVNTTVVPIILADDDDFQNALLIYFEDDNAPDSLGDYTIDEVGVYSNVSTRDNIANWVTTNVTTMHYTFSQSTPNNITYTVPSDFNQDLSSWDVSNVKSFSFMFYTCKLFNNGLDPNVNDIDNDLSTWDTSSCTDFDNMFDGCPSLNQNLSSWLLQMTPTLSNTDEMLAGTYMQTDLGWSSTPTIIEDTNNLGFGHIYINNVIPDV